MNDFGQRTDEAQDKLDSGEKSKEKSSLVFAPASQVMEHTNPPDWLIKHYLEARTLATIIGPPSSLKSFLVVDWGLHLAAGKDWYTHKIKRPRNVAFLIGEGYRGFRKRFKAWGIANRIAVERLPACVSTRAGALYDDPTEIIEAIPQSMPPELLIIDTLSRNAGSADENSTLEMAQLIRNLDQIKDHFGCTVLIVHHTPHETTKRGRGSSVVYAAMDFEYLLERESMRLTVTCRKAKDHEPPKPIVLLATKVELEELDEDGELITSIALNPGVDFSGIVSGLGENQQKVLDLIAKLYVEKKAYLKTNGQDPYNAKVKRSDLSESVLKISRQRISEACIFCSIPITDSGLNRSPILVLSDH